MKTKIKYLKNIIVIAILTLGVTHETMAQLDPLGMQHYKNQYLGNPAMAGISTGLDFNFGFRYQWSNIPGAPTTQAITAAYGMEKAGFGLIMYNDAAGLLKRTRVTGTYAYHLPLNGEDNKLHFGISLGMMYERIENQDIDADQSDQSISRYSSRENYIDGDFGVAYTSKTLTLQAAVPNLQQFTNRKSEFRSVDRSLFLVSASYRWSLGERENAVSLTPKLTFRGVKGYDNIIDAGVNVGIVNDKVWLMGMYHSSESATFGLGTTYNSFSFMGMYTTETTALRSYTNGTFEVSLGYKFKPKSER